MTDSTSLLACSGGGWGETCIIAAGWGLEDEGGHVVGVIALPGGYADQGQTCFFHGPVVEGVGFLCFGAGVAFIVELDAHQGLEGLGIAEQEVDMARFDAAAQLLPLTVFQVIGDLDDVLDPDLGENTPVGLGYCLQDPKKGQFILGYQTGPPHEGQRGIVL